jgi:hypothetical protein
MAVLDREGLGITRSELAILTLLLENKSPNTRSSTLTLSRNMLPIKVESGMVIENIQEVKNVLNSLEKKGIVKVDMIETITRERQSTLAVTEKYTEIEKLNIMYILGQLKDEEYEKLFSRVLLQQSGNELSGILPLTLIQRYINILGNYISPMSHIDFGYYESLLPKNLELKEHNSIIIHILASLVQSFLSILQKYVKQVVEITNEKNIDTKELKGFIYLYPFLQPIIRKVKKKINVTRADLVEKLKKEIQVEKEIINVLEFLREDEQKVEMHRNKLRTLENKLNEIEQYEEREVFVLTLPGSAVRVLFMNLFGKPSVYIQHILDEFIDQISTALYNNFFKNLYQNKRGKLEIDLHQVLKESQEKENVTGEDRYIIKASLTWINEFCPAMQDSVIDSEGRELVLCNNPECFVVYHKRCLDSLRQAGVHSCLVCGIPT